jgi:hypothetical protein
LDGLEQQQMTLNQIGLLLDTFAGLLLAPHVVGVERLQRVETQSRQRASDIRDRLSARRQSASLRSALSSLPAAVLGAALWPAVVLALEHLFFDPLDWAALRAEWPPSAKGVAVTGARMALGPESYPPENVPDGIREVPTLLGLVPEAAVLFFVGSSAFSGYTYFIERRPSRRVTGGRFERWLAQIFAVVGIVATAPVIVAVVLWQLLSYFALRCVAVPFSHGLAERLVSRDGLQGTLAVAGVALFIVGNAMQLLAA